MDVASPWPALIKRLRFLSSLKQCELAQQLGVDQGTVSRWERGTSIPDTYVQKHLRDMMRKLEPAIDRNFIEQTPAIVIVSRVESVGFVSAMSPAAAAAYQLTPPDMRDRRIYEMTSESIRGFIDELELNPAWRGGDIAMWEARLRRVDGNWARFTGSPIGRTGFFMCIGAIVPAQKEWIDKSYQLTLESYDELSE